MNPVVRITNIRFGSDSSGNAVTRVKVYLESSLLEAECEISVPQSSDLRSALDEAQGKLKECLEELLDIVRNAPLEFST